MKIILTDPDPGFRLPCGDSVRNPKVLPEVPTPDQAIEDFTPRLSKLASAYANGDYHLGKDLFQEGAMGLLRAAHRFDAARGAKFSTFADWHMRGAMQNFLRAEFKHKSLRSLNDQSWRIDIGEEQLDDELPRTVIECMGAMQGFLFDVELELVREPLRVIEDGFTERQRQIFRLRYRDGLTPGEVARLIQVSPARVSQVLSEAVIKLRRLLMLN
jgi:RNA polymerase sigma factor for flagellar operon FliA